MTSKPLKTSDLAKALGVHVNTIRLYELEHPRLKTLLLSTTPL